MKNKIVLWGANEADERILVALELKVNRNKVSIYTFKEAVATDDFYSEMMSKWRDSTEETNFTQEHEHIERELSITEGLLPDNIKVERTDIIQRAQTEWHFVILSSKLSEAYHNELQELEEKIAGLKDFDKEVWEGLKTFWAKVQNQIRDRTIFREHANTLRTRTDKGFEELKAMRGKMEEGFRKTSAENMDRFNTIIDDVENKIKENKHLAKVFEELKKIQKEIRAVDFTREHRNKLWNRVDKAFKDVKTKRFGAQEGGDNSPVQRLQNRYNGLMNAIDRMQKSIKHDENELAFQNRQIERTDGQLEAQIRQAKLKMIQQRVTSKQEKLDDMLKTKMQLEERIEKEKEREAARKAKREEEKARAAAKKKAKAKIAEDIKEKQASIEESDDALASAAQAINEQKSRGKKKITPPNEQANDAEPQQEKAETSSNEESIFSAIATTIGESLEDVVDTIKAVAEVVGDQIEEKVEEAKQEFKEAVDTAKATAEVVSDKVEKKVEEVKQEFKEAVDAAKAAAEEE